MNNASKTSLIFIAIAFACSSDNKPLNPEMRPLIEAVYASGYVVAKDEYELISMVDGYISSKLTADGDVVRKGDPIYIIDSDQQSARHRIAEESFEHARRNLGPSSPVLQELKTAVRTARTKMEFDSTNYHRYANLLKQNATTRAEHDRFKVIYENALSDFQVQQNRYARTLDQLTLEFRNARNNILISGDEAGKYIIRSEVDGRVFMTSKEKGELIRRGEVVGIVGSDQAFYFQLNVDEEDVNRLRSGQEVLIRVDAYPEKVFRGHISKIYPMVDRKQQAVRVDAELAEPFPAGFSGLALEANIIIRKKDNALVIPKNYLLPGDSVLVETSDGIRKVKVEKGIETLDEVEITRGIDSTTVVLLTNR